jgi:DNA modification methylase
MELQEYTRHKNPLKFMIGYFLIMQARHLILDTHLGSGSSRIAAYKGGFNFVGFEIDQEYYEKQEKRFNDFKSQLRLF